MKLMYDLPADDKAAFEAAVGSDEKLMYCLPFTIYEDRFVKGYMAFTNKTMYKLLDGKLLGTWPIIGSSDFKTEVMYGCCGFYAKVDGASTLICRFVSGRDLPRYAVIVRACEILNEQKDDKDPTPITNSTPERFCPVCNRPYIRATTICPYCMDKKEIYKKLFAMTKGIRLMMSFPFLVAVFSVIFQFVVPYIEGQAIDKYINPSSGVHGPISGFIAIVIAIVSIDLFQRALGVLQGRFSAIAGNKFTLMLKTVLYEKLQSLSLASIQRRTTGDLMGRVNSDTAVMQDFVTNQLPTYFIQIVTFLISLPVLAFMNWKMCLFIFVPIPLVVFITSKVWDFVRSRNLKLWVLSTRTGYLLHDILNGIRVVKGFGMEEYEITRFKESSIKSSNQSESNAKVFDTIFPLLGLLIRIGSYFILLYGYMMIFRGKMELGFLHQINSYANMVYAPLMYITFIPRNISNFLTSASKVFEILEEEPDVQDIGLPLDISIEGEIDVKNITFGYESYNPVLENVSVRIEPGEMIGIVGHSGSGKSTLINLIMRLYDVNEGAIMIDDVNIKDISQNALRSQMGVVLQETFLFSGTVQDNIRYSKPFATEEEVIRAARAANAHDFIINLPEGYNTIVGEKGYSMSGGERQRIAIARAIIHDPKILILDEATASLDTETEKLIQDAMVKLVQNRTTLAIAHRLSTLRNADKLLVLDHGKVAEFGTHSELLANKGIYWKLVMAQRKMSQDVERAQAEKHAEKQTVSAAAK
jgi:ATP-binding cassette subfamily B protein